MPLTENGNPVAIPVSPASRWIWISICLLFAMISISGCHPTRSVTPSEEGGGNINRLQPISPDPEASPEDARPQFGAASHSTPTAPEVRPPADTASAVPDTPTPAATAAADLSPPPVLGGADKIAYLDANDIWMANLDGSGLTRLTHDGQVKSNLQWSPDGQAITFISADKCFYRLSIADRIAEKLACFPFAQYFRAFEVSPDGAQIALSIDNWLYLLPNDLALLKTIDSHADLTQNASCEFFDPLEKDPDHRIAVKFTRWSDDGRRLAFVTHSADRQVGAVSIVRVVSYDDCRAAPRALSYFPAWHLLPEEYQHYPALTGFGWDGDALFSFIAATDRATGLGGLFLYDTGSWKLSGPVNWITECCYHDPTFSPDGSQLLFAYQAEPPDGGLRFYLATLEAIDNPLALTPLPLPEIDLHTTPGAALRQAIPAPGP
jgi:hypothetical protein